MTDLTPGQAEISMAEPCIDDGAHHWLIGRQDGPSSEGTCKSCGATRDFTNAYSRTYRSPMYLGRPSRTGPTHVS